MLQQLLSIIRWYYRQLRVYNLAFPIYSVDYSGTNLDRDITETIVTDSRQGLKTRVGTATFQVQNVNNRFQTSSTLQFKIDDACNIYMGYQNIGSFIVFPGFVNEITQITDKNQQNIKISLVNKLERMLSMMDAKDYPPSGSTASQILTDVITRINGYRKSGEPAIGTGQIETTTGSITPYAFNYKPVIDILKELSATEYTHNGQYIYYIDNSNNLVYKPRPGVSNITISEYQFTEFNANYGIFDVVNAVIVNCGNDSNGAAVLVMGVNYGSVTEIGFRWKYYKNDVAGEIRQQGYAVATERAKIKEKGQIWANSMVKTLGEPRWRIEATCKGTVYYPGTTTQMVQGEAIKITSPSNWSGNKVLRLQDIRQNFSAKGWMTTIEIEEDDKTKGGL